MIEPAIDRTFGVLVAEDDFSAAGHIDYRAASVHSEETDFAQVQRALDAGAKLLAQYLQAVPAPRRS